MTIVHLALIVAATGLVLLWLCWRFARKRRLVRSGASALGGLGCLLLAALLATIALNVYTYHRLTHEQKIAGLELVLVTPNQFEATLSEADGETRVFKLIGDEWILEARILKWHGLANLLGLDTLYRLDRLGGRFQDIELERVGPRTVYALSANAGLDLWKAAQEHQQWLPWVDASYGSATYLPMADNARFDILATQSGLIARPTNESARESVVNWQ